MGLVNFVLLLLLLLPVLLVSGGSGEWVDGWLGIELVL